MTISIPLGWWLAPLLVTICAYALAWWRIMVPDNGSYIGSMIIGAAALSIATIVSLAAWLAWTLLT